MPTELELIEAYGDMSTSLIKKAGDAAEKAFYALPDYRQAYFLQYVEEYENILFGARLQAAQMAMGFHAEVARANGKRFIAPKLRKEDFFARNLRKNLAIGARPDQQASVYQARPFRELYKNLRKTGDMTQAVAAGGARARILAQTDVQLARRQASLFARRANDNVVGYIRVLTGAENCGLCYVASTQRYNKNNLNPIHPGCDCGELPIYGDTDPGQVIDQYNLDRIHEAFETRFGVDDPGARDLGIGKFVEYKDGVRQADFSLVSIRDHGELGPVLTRRNEKFTTLEDIQRRIAAREQLVIQGVQDLLDEGIDLTVGGLASSARQARQRVAAAKTPGKVGELMGEFFNARSEGWGGEAGGKLPRIADELAKTQSVANTLVDLQEKYPVNLERLAGPGAATNQPGTFAYASARKRTFENKSLGFNRSLFSQTETVYESSNSGHFPTWLANNGVDPVQYVVTHEYGHLLDYQGKMKTKPNAVVDDLFKEWLAEREESPSELARQDFVESEMSGYATTNAREFVAEAFAEYHILGDQAGPVATRVAEAVLKNYSEALDG